MDTKSLSESALKAVFSKNKVKDNGLQKSLAAYGKLQEDDYDGRMAELGRADKLASALLKQKEVSAVVQVSEYVEDVLGAANAVCRDLEKQKAAKTKAAVADKKKEEEEQKEKDKAEKKGGNEEEEEEEGDFGARLDKGLKKLRSMHGQSMQFALVIAKPDPAIMVAKRISQKVKEEVSKIAGGGHCLLGEISSSGNNFVLNPLKPRPGLAKAARAAVKAHTNKKYKFMCGDESSDDEGDEGQSEGQAETPEEMGRKAGAAVGAMAGGNAGPAGEAGGPAAAAGGNAGGAAAGQGKGAPEGTPPAPSGPFSLKGTVGKGGKNTPADVQQVQAALNKMDHAGLKVDGVCDPGTIAAIVAFQKKAGVPQADGVVAPGRGTARVLAGQAKMAGPAAEPKTMAPPKLGKATLNTAPLVWHGTRSIVENNIAELKKAVMSHYGLEEPALLKQIEQSLGKLNVVLEKLDTRLSDTLSRANASKNETAKAEELKAAKGIIVDYIKFVKSEPLIKHIDDNPFGVNTHLGQVITDSLSHMAQSLANGAAEAKAPAAAVA